MGRRDNDWITQRRGAFEGGRRKTRGLVEDLEEILHIVAKHPTVDLLRLLAESDWDPYKLTRELGIGYRTCYLHLSILEKAGLIGGRRFKYCITEKGKEILSRLDDRGVRLND